MSARAIALRGCRPQPLASYLKGLGVHRLVAEQRDAQASSWWTADALHIEAAVDRHELETFFLESYRPTPIVSPWNGSSGFDHRTVPEVDVIAESGSPRLVDYRTTIDVARRIVKKADGLDLPKEELLLRMRAWLPDEALQWLDAAVVLTEDGASYPPLLGTGGNLGRLELSRNFMGHLARVLALETGRGAATAGDSARWLRASLFDEEDPKLVKASIAQYDPGPAGGANAAPTGKAESVVNPWDFILVLEGALLFASAAARRLGSDSRGTAAMPFTTRAAATGYASSATDESSRGEFWAPLWERPAVLGELRQFLAEGRADWAGRQARTGVDFARAIAALGVDRGIDRFIRHAFVERLGQMTLAVPVGVVEVRERPEVRVLQQLDRWLERIARARNVPAGVASARNRVESSMYDVATRGGADRLQVVLITVARLHRLVERATSLRESTGTQPLGDLLADDWLERLDDGSDEFAVAVSVASGREPDGHSVRTLLTGVRPSADGRWLEWSERPAPTTGLGSRRIDEVLADALQRHAVERGRGPGSAPDPVDDVDHASHGILLGFTYQRRAPLASVLRLVSRELDLDRLADLVNGLLLLNWRPRTQDGARGPRGRPDPAVPTPAACLVLPYFHHAPLRVADRRLLLRCEPSWPRLLAADRVDEVVLAAARRARIAGLPVPDLHPQRASAGTAGTLLATAAMCRLARSDLERLLRHASPPELEGTEQR